MSPNHLMVTFSTSVLNKLYSASRFTSRAYLCQCQPSFNNLGTWAPYMLTFFNNTLEYLFWNSTITPSFFLTSSESVKLFTFRQLRRNLLKTHQRLFTKGKVRNRYNSLSHLRYIPTLKAHRKPVRSVTTLFSQSEQFNHPYFILWKPSLKENLFPLFNPIKRHRRLRSAMLIETIRDKRNIQQPALRSRRRRWGRPFKKNQPKVQPLVYNPLVKFYRLKKQLTLVQEKKDATREGQILAFAGRKRLRLTTLSSFRSKRRLKARKTVSRWMTNLNSNRLEFHMKRLEYLCQQLNQLRWLSLRQPSLQKFKAKLQKLITPVLCQYSRELYHTKLTSKVQRTRFSGQPDFKITRKLSQRLRQSTKKSSLRLQHTNRLARLSMLVAPSALFRQHRATTYKSLALVREGAKTRSILQRRSLKKLHRVFKDPIWRTNTYSHKQRYTYFLKSVKRRRADRLGSLFAISKQKFKKRAVRKFITKSRVTSQRVTWCLPVRRSRKRKNSLKKGPQSLGLLPMLQPCTPSTVKSKSQPWIRRPQGRWVRKRKWQGWKETVAWRAHQSRPSSQFHRLATPHTTRGLKAFLLTRYISRYHYALAHYFRHTPKKRERKGRILKRFVNNLFRRHYLVGKSIRLQTRRFLRVNTPAHTTRKVQPLHPSILTNISAKASQLSVRATRNPSSSTPKLFQKPEWFKTAVTDFKSSKQLSSEYSSVYEKHPRLLRLEFVRKSKKGRLRVRKQAIPRQTLFLNLRAGRLNWSHGRPLKSRLLRIMRQWYARKGRRYNSKRLHFVKKRLDRQSKYVRLLTHRRALLIQVRRRYRNSNPVPSFFGTQCWEVYNEVKGLDNSYEELFFDDLTSSEEPTLEESPVDPVSPFGIKLACRGVLQDSRKADMIIRKSVPAQRELFFQRYQPSAPRSYHPLIVELRKRIWTKRIVRVHMYRLRRRRRRRKQKRVKVRRTTTLSKVPVVRPSTDVVFSRNLFTSPAWGRYSQQLYKPTVTRRCFKRKVRRRLNQLFAYRKVWGQTQLFRQLYPLSAGHLTVLRQKKAGNGEKQLDEHQQWCESLLEGAKELKITHASLISALTARELTAPNRTDVSLTLDELDNIQALFQLILDKIHSLRVSLAKETLDLETLDLDSVDLGDPDLRLPNFTTIKDSLGLQDVEAVTPAYQTSPTQPHPIFPGTKFRRRRQRENKRISREIAVTSSLLKQNETKVVEFLKRHLKKLKHSVLVEQSAVSTMLDPVLKPLKDFIRLNQTVTTYHGNVYSSLSELLPVVNHDIQILLATIDGSFPEAYYRLRLRYMGALRLNRTLYNRLFRRRRVVSKTLSNSRAFTSWQLLWGNLSQLRPSHIPTVPANLTPERFSSKQLLDSINHSQDEDYQYWELTSSDNLDWKNFSLLRKSMAKKVTNFTYTALENLFEKRKGLITQLQTFVGYPQLNTPLLNEFNPKVLNSRYFRQQQVRIREAELAIHQRHGVKFVLSNLGFLYNPKLVQNYTTNVLSKILKERYSFFSISHVKRVLIKRRGMGKFKEILAAFPSSKNLSITTPSTYSTLSTHLSQINTLISRQVNDTSRQYIHSEEGHSNLFVQPFKPDVRTRVRIRRIRFKPGYSRIWRQARASLNQSMRLNFRYQYRFTIWLNRYTRTSRCTHERLADLKLINVIMRSRFTFDIKTSLDLINNNVVYLNGRAALNPELVLFAGDVVQLIVSLQYYIVYRWLINWNRFKRTRLNKLARAKFKKIHHAQTKQRSSKIPNWVLTTHVKISDIPKFLEVDFFTLSSCVVYDPFLSTEFQFFDILESRAEIYNMYNWKYVN